MPKQWNKKPLRGELNVPGDKSISHRAIMLGSIAQGITTITNFLDSEDCQRTVAAFQSLGVHIKSEGSRIQISGLGKEGLKEPLEPIYIGNSGTTARLLLGILAGLRFSTVLYGDASLTKRPMDRVVKPLMQMGAKVDGRNNASNLPLAIRGKKLASISYQMPVKSAQVKSAVLLAGLFAEGQTIVKEKSNTRDHTEKMLRAFGVQVQSIDDKIILTPPAELHATSIHIPGDISSAAFFIGGALLKEDSCITIRNVGLNPTRTGILDVLQEMGATLSIAQRENGYGEEIGDITVTYSELSGTVIEGDIIPRLIDELPILALIATQANGTTIVRNAEELKVKETNRIDAVVEVLTTFGAKIEATDDGMIIHGKTKLHAGYVSTYHDHRIAMMISIASLIMEELPQMDDDTCINISYPNFHQHLNQLMS
ncbi:3-phosphoshikimate 1-carboxyvinyltransferase [Virgibacillus soli]|uniref:3-phosphoshikimate 1-carboxyvinyltransferase n=1 Tax=Paracerasibacillus soli TaxID=480284 RepID=UPI0035E6F035